MKFIPYILFFLFSFQASAQSLFNEVIASAGTYYDGNVSKTAWTVGEIVITTESEDGHILTQGFHQPMTGYIPIKQTKVPIDVEKPTVVIEDDQSGGFKINIKTKEYSQITYTLSNVIGQIILKDNTYTGPEGADINLNTSNLAKGIYFFNVYKKNQNKFDVKSIKILKHSN